MQQTAHKFLGLVVKVQSEEEFQLAASAGSAQKQDTAAIKCFVSFRNCLFFFFLFLTFRGIAKDTKPGEMIAWTEKGERDFWRPIGESVPREEL